MTKSSLRKLFLLKFNINNCIPGCVDCKEKGGLYVLNHPMKGLDLVLVASLFPEARFVVSKKRLSEVGCFFEQKQLISTGGSVDKIISAINSGIDVFIFYRRIHKIGKKRSIRTIMNTTGCELFMVKIASDKPEFDKVYAKPSNLNKLLYFAKLVLTGNRVELSGTRINSYNRKLIRKQLTAIY